MIAGTLLLGGLFIWPTAKASIYDQPYTDVPLYLQTDAVNNTIEFDFGITTNADYNSSQINIPIQNSTCAGSSKAHLSVSDTSAGWTLVISQDSSVATGLMTDRITFNISYTFINGHNYYAIVNVPCQSAGQHMEILSSAWANSYIGLYQYARHNLSNQICPTTNFCGTYRPGFFLDGFSPAGAPTTTAYSISFENITQNVRTPDFLSWQTPFSFTNQALPKNYSVGVKYKQASSTPWQFEDLGNLQNLPESNYSSTWDMNKYHNLTPGNWIAEAQLYAGGKDPFTTTVYDPNQYHWQILATSTLMSFTIATSTNWAPGLIPRDLDATSTQISTYCPPTSFSISFWSGYEVDFGQGLCKIFVPDTQLVKDQIRTLVTSAGTKIPFSYVTEMQSIFASSTSSTTASLPEIAINTSATSSMPNGHFVLFSSSTLSSAFNNYGFSGLRTVANIILYAGFAYGLYRMAIAFAHKRDK